MIEFMHPWALLLLLALPFLLWLRLGRRRRTTVRFSHAPLLRQLPTSWAVTWHRLLPVFFTLAMGLLTVALARPRTGEEESKINAEVVDMVLLVDLSTSMRALDFATEAEPRRNRLDAAKEVMERFVSQRRGDRIGMVAFAAASYTVAPLTADHDWVVTRMHELRTGMLEDGTFIGAAIASAVNRLRDSEAVSKIVVLLTDGVHNDPSGLSPENAARAAEALGIKVYTIGAGREGYVPMPAPFGGTIRQRSEIDEQVLQRIADITGARYFRADRFEALEEISREIDELERTEIEIEAFTRYRERFPPLALGALTLLLLERWWALGRAGRLVE